MSWGLGDGTVHRGPHFLWLCLVPYLAVIRVIREIRGRQLQFLAPTPQQIWLVNRPKGIFTNR
jgi:hypothetical protein